MSAPPPNPSLHRARLRSPLNSISLGFQDAKPITLSQSSTRHRLTFIRFSPRCRAQASSLSVPQEKGVTTMTHRQLKTRLGSLSVVLLIAGHAEHLFAQTPAPGPSPLPISSSLMTSDTADSPPYASFVFVNKASLPVTAVAVVAKQKENRLATPIPVGDSWALSNIQPADHQCIELVKANSRMDLLCMELKAGKTYTYTITDGEADYAGLSIINNTSLPIVAVKVGSNQSANLLSSPIQPAVSQLSLTFGPRVSAL
jgi:hypothetical protein